MSNIRKIKETDIVVPDVWTGRKIERDIATFEDKHSKQVEILKRRVEDLEYALDSVERAFRAGFIGLVILNLAVVAIMVF